MFKGILITTEGAHIIGDISDDLNLFIMLSSRLSDELQNAKKKEEEDKLNKLISSLTKEQIVNLLKTKENK